MAKHLPKTIAEKYIESLYEKWYGLDAALRQEGPRGNGNYYSAAISAMIRSGLSKEDIQERLECSPSSPLLLEPADVCLADYWSSSKHVYRFDEAMFDELERQVVPDAIPVSALAMIPYPLMFVEAPVYAPVAEDLAILTRGFFVFVSSFAGLPKLFFCFVDKSLAGLSLSVDLAEGQLISDLAKRINDDLLSHMQKDGMTEGIVEVSAQKCLAQMLNLVLYINSENADIREVYCPSGQTRKQKTSQSTIYLVGEKIGAALGAARRVYEGGEESGGGHGTMKLTPHVRRAHFHTYHVKGPEGEDRLILKWLSPILVNMGDEAAVTVHRAKGDSGSSSTLRRDGQSRR